MVSSLIIFFLIVIFITKKKKNKLHDDFKVLHLFTYISRISRLYNIKINSRWTLIHVRLIKKYFDKLLYAAAVPHPVYIYNKHEKEIIF